MKKIMNPWLDIDGYFCFGCSPDNPAGLKMEFYEDGDDIVSKWKPSEYTQGWIKTLHGGIQCTLMDEIGAWVVARKLQTSGVTANLEAKFIKSISTDEPELTIRARIRDRKRRAVFLEAEICNSAGELCARADMTYFLLDPEKSSGEMFFKECRLEEE